MLSDFFEISHTFRKQKKQLRETAPRMGRKVRLFSNSSARFITMCLEKLEVAPHRFVL